MGTRELAKKAVRSEISKAALSRFRAAGFDQTTVEEIAADVGMSSRTFFRYFSSKDDLLLGPTNDFGVRFLDHLKAELSGNDLWRAVSLAISQSALQWGGDAAECGWTAVQEIIESSPALQARQLALSEQLHCQATNLLVYEHPQGRELGPLRVGAIVRACFACLRTVDLHYEGKLSASATHNALSELFDEMMPAMLSRGGADPRAGN